jgi:predicted enzyme related to lactoylglutathione lyase
MKGKIGWIDLTVENAEEVRDFYSKVAGWSPSPVDMGDYSDYNMILRGTEDPVAGICHARGMNSDLPPQWIIYITVENLDGSILECEKLGGKVIVGPITYGEGARYCVIRDPAGNVSALCQEGSDSQDA